MNINDVIPMDVDLCILFRLTYLQASIFSNRTSILEDGECLVIQCDNTGVLAILKSGQDMFMVQTDEE